MTRTCQEILMYRVELDGRSLGETALESADPPMGVVMGKVEFSVTESPYDLFKSYCAANELVINQDEEKLELIDTQNIPGLKVFREDGVEIVGEPGASICGFRDDGYEVTIIGIPYPFYDEEFPHHREAYDEKFSSESAPYDPLNDYGVGHATTPVSMGGGLLKTIIGWFRS